MQKTSQTTLISRKTSATRHYSNFSATTGLARDISPAAIEAYRKVVSILPRFQIEAGRDLNYKVCYPRSSFDRQSIAWDLNYFKYYFLRLAGIPFSEQALENDFTRLTKLLLAAPHDYFLYRDFQSRNVMLRDGQPFFLDYQGGRKGALQYDIASLLYDGKADLPPAVRQQLLDYYLDCLAEFIPVDRAAFMEYYYAYVYVRIMQALGAYGFRGFYERKAHFLQSRSLRTEKPPLARPQRQASRRSPRAHGVLSRECSPPRNCTTLRPARTSSRSASSASRSITRCR